MIRTFTLGALLALTALLFHAPAFAAAGELDPAFGAGGISRIPASVLSSTKILATARQADGKILVAGQAQASVAWSPDVSATPRGAVVGRFNADGSVDTSFGREGWFVADLSSFTQEARAVAIVASADGGVLVGLQFLDTFQSAVMRLTPEGVKDSSFTATANNSNGVAVLYFASGDLTAMAEAPNGRIVVAMGDDIGDAQIYAMDPATGFPDASFGVNGAIVWSASNGPAARIRALHVRADGSLFAAGWTDPFGGFDVISRDFLVAKFTPAGVPDPQFGVGGRVAFDFNGRGDEAFTIAEDGQSRLLVGGKAGWANTFDTTSGFGAARMDPVTGALDPSFGTGGKVSLFVAPWFSWESIVTAIQPASDDSGDLLLGGYAHLFDSDPEIVSILARVDTAGNFVPAFGLNGIVRTAPSFDSTFAATGDSFAAVEVSGGTILAIGTRAILVGQPFESPVRSFALAERFTESSGAPAGSALQVEGIDAVAASVIQSVSLSDGRFLTVGAAGNMAHVMRFLAAGTIDTSFGNGGRADFQANALPTSGRAIGLDGNGNILVASIVRDPAGPDGRRWSIARLSAEGVVDPSFANGDVAINSLGGDIAAIRVQPDGKIVVAGDTHAFAIVRLNADGSLDTGFNGSGIVLTGAPDVHVTSLVLQPDGRLLVAGDTTVIPDYIVGTIMRLASDGSVDTSWGNGGIVDFESGLGGVTTTDAMALQADGKVVIGGITANWQTNGQPLPVLARLGPDGSRDFEFGPGGVVQDSASLGPAFITGIGLQRDGKIVAAGDLSSGVPFAFRLARDGTLDSSYNGTGSTRASAQSGAWIASFPDSNGSVRLLGSSPASTGVEELVFVQFQGQSVYDVPDPIVFPDATDVPVSQLVTSAAVTISGINVAVPITIEEGEYSIGCNGTFTSAAGTISNGQSLCVRHTSAASGNTSRSSFLLVGSVSASFTSVTGTLPETTLASSPPPLVASTSGTFTFASSDPLATFRCSLDGAGFAACSSPATYGQLAEGFHEFRVEAVNRIGADPSPAQASWRIDITPPDTAIDSGPSGNNNPDTASFTFSSTEGGSSFECSLDDAPFAACASPVSLARLDHGLHAFAVRARDSAGNVDPTPASRSWRTH